jgi:hypothetical protein
MARRLTVKKKIWGKTIPKADLPLTHDRTWVKVSMVMKEKMKA